MAEWKVNLLPSASSELDQLNDSVREQAIQSIVDLAGGRSEGVLKN